MSEVPNKRTVRSIQRKIVAEAAKVAASRDRIRDLLTTLEAYDEAWNDASESLSYAADRLSELL